MSAILEGKPDKNLILVTGRIHPKLAEDVAEQLGIDVLETTAYDFANGEMYVRYTESVRGADVFVLQSHYKPINKAIMEQLIMIDAFRRASAGRITAVVPYFGYARQDRKVKAREPISAKLCANLISTAGADRVLTMDLHAAQIQGFFDIPVDHLLGVPLLAPYFGSRFGRQERRELVVVSPDLGSVTRARKFAERLDAPLAIVDKRRQRANVSEVMNIIGDVKDKRVILVDDMIDTAGTLVNAAQAVLEKGGAAEVYACATHGVLSGPAIDRIRDSCIRELVLLDTIPVGPDKMLDKITMLSVAPVFAEAIERIYQDKPVSPLFG